jgi:hypothetical protein
MCSMIPLARPVAANPEISNRFPKQRLRLPPGQQLDVNADWRSTPEVH